MDTVGNKLRFIRSAFGSAQISRDGRNVAVRCPSCQKSSDKKKFSISLDSWQCHCWVCGIKGRTPYSIIKNNISEDLAKDFKRIFLGKADLSSADAIPTVESTVQIPEGFELICQNLKTQDPDKRACIKYLYSRNISLKDLWFYKIGFSSSFDYNRRVIIPSFDLDGMPNYFCSRTVDEKGFPKYKNAVANKTEIIFNEMNIDWSKELTIVEGPFDLMKCNQNATCILGSVLRSDSYLFNRIVSNQTPVLLALDRDMSKKISRYANELSSYGCKVRTLDLGEYSDVGDMKKDVFLKKRSSAQVWTQKERLFNKINSMTSGSVF